MNKSQLVFPESAPTDWQGALHLEFAGHAGKTQLIHNLGKAPLKVQRPFYPEGDEICHCVMIHTAGGVVGGDRLSLNLRLHPNAHALITSPAATKLYRTNGKVAHQDVTIDVASGACLEWLPLETIVFDGAQFQQTVRIQLAPDAQWLGWEITRFGRTARDEKFLNGEWRSRTEIWQNDRPVWIDRQWLPGHETVFNSPHGLADRPVVGTFAYIGQSLDSDFIQHLRSLWIGTGEVGVTRLQSGFICRYRGTSTTEARTWFAAVWSKIRAHAFDRSAPIPRVWGV